MYSFKKSAVKTLVRLAIAGIPLLMTILPKAWMNLTVAGVLMLSFDWLKARFLTLE